MHDQSQSGTCQKETVAKTRREENNIIKQTKNQQIRKKCMASMKASKEETAELSEGNQERREREDKDGSERVKASKLKPPS